MERIEVPIDLGRTALPATVMLEQRPFLVTEPSTGAYALLSTLCPHAGGRVADVGSHLECPNHGWRFDRDSGHCINIPGESLSSVPVEIEHGRMYASTSAVLKAGSPLDDLPG